MSAQEFAPLCGGWFYVVALLLLLSVSMGILEDWWNE